MDEPAYHVPVLLQEVISGLNVRPDGVYVDCTFGGGGHSKEILKYLNQKGKLFAFDQDADAKKNLPDDQRVIFVPHNFRHLQRFLRLHKFLFWNYKQVNHPATGLSYVDIFLISYALG